MHTCFWYPKNWVYIWKYSLYSLTLAEYVDQLWGEINIITTANKSTLVIFQDI